MSRKTRKSALQVKDRNADRDIGTMTTVNDDGDGDDNGRGEAERRLRWEVQKRRVAGWDAG